MPRNAGRLGRQAKQLTDTSAAKRSARRLAVRKPAGPPRSCATSVTSCQLQLIHDGRHCVGGMSKRRRGFGAVTEPAAGGVDRNTAEVVCSRMRTSRQTKLHEPT